jgi:FkbM family methyltransferase
MERADMRFLQLIKWLTYRKSLIQAARFFRLQGSLESVYNRLMRPRSGISSISVKDVEAKFHVDQPGELRIVEVIGSSRGGEHRLIELLFRVSRPGDVFLDIGASIGTHSILMAKYLGASGRVIAFEPEPNSYGRFLANIALNQLSNITVFPLALGEEEKAGTLRNVEGLGTFTLTSPDGETGAGAVKIVPGDRLREEKGLPVPGVVKIDVEGYEYSVLQGLRRTLADPACRVVCYEHHTHLLPPHLGLKEFEELMTSMGFPRHEINRRLGGFHLIWYKD